MDPKRARELTLAAAAMALIAIAGWTLFRSTANPAGAVASTGATAADAQARAKSPLTEVDLKGLEAERPEPADSTRNPFQFKPKLPPPPPPSAVIAKPPQAAEQGANVPVEPPPLPQIPLKYIGDMSDPKNPGRRIAILSDARSTYYGREGEIVEGRYKILRIGVESIELAYLDGRGRHLLGQPDRIPEGDRHGRQQDRELIGACRDRGGEEVRGRQMAVVGAVMLGQHRDQRAARFRPRAHVDGRRVKLRRGCAGGGCAHVEPQGEHQRRVQAGVVTSSDSNLNFVPSRCNSGYYSK
jgi:hypothetical protein